MNYFSPHIISAFDPVVERFVKIPTSFSEKEALKENFWDVGEDAQLREDFRSRLTPGGRWIISECLLANDELRKILNWRQMVPPSRDGYTFVAPGFEEDVGDDLAALAIEGLSY